MAPAPAGSFKFLTLGVIINKILLSLIAAAFSAGIGAAYAAGEMDAKLVTVCKDTKPGETVKVDNKEVKCPEAKKGEKSNTETNDQSTLIVPDVL